VNFVYTISTIDIVNILQTQKMFLLWITYNSSLTEPLHIFADLIYLNFMTLTKSISGIRGTIGGTANESLSLIDIKFCRQIFHQFSITKIFISHFRKSL